MEQDEIDLKCYLEDRIQDRIDDETQKYYDKLKELEKRIERLEQIMQRSVTEVVIRI